jgi:thioredoxin reductase
VGRRIEATDLTGKTAVPGVWAAGNASDVMAWVVAAASAGALAGAGINADLVGEDTRAAVERAAAVRDAA